MALLDEIRQKNPSLRDRSDDELKAVLRQSPEFKYFDDNEFNAFVSGQETQASESSPGFMSGVSAGIDQVQAMGGGLVMAAGEAMESEGMLNAGRDIYQRNMDEADENSLGYGFTDIRSAGDAWNWARYTAGNQLPMLAASVAGGGVGGAAAGLTARTLAGAAAKEGAKRVGQALGAAGASTGMETGALMGETENLDVSLAHGVLAGSLDAVTPLRLLRAAGRSEVADQAASEISDRVLADLQREAARTTRGAAARGSLTNLMAEASTEGLQGLINQHANYWVENNGETLLANLGEVDLKALVDEAAAGGLMGGVIGAPTGVMERNQSRTQSQRIEQAREQVAAQGGDALDQATAGLGAEQAAASEAPQPQGPTPEMSADIGNRIQLAMGEVDDLRSMARGSSFEGSTRLRNMSTILDRAERAYEEGKVEQAGRLADRAQGIANNLRSALRQAGTRERPLEGELAEDQPVSGLLGQDSAPRLNAPDPNIINMGGPTADQTQYDPQARNVRRDEGMQAQREGAERLRSQVAGQRPQLTDSGTIYGDGPTLDVEAERQRRRAAFEQQYGTAQNTGLDGEYMGPDPVPGRPNRQGDTYDSETYRRPERLRQDTAPRLAQSDTIYGDGPIAGNANTGMDRPFERARFTDTGARDAVEGRRPQQQESAERVAQLARTRGQSQTTYLPDNTPIRTRSRVIEASELTASNTPDGRVNSRYPQELQPRDRTNANSQVQVRNIAARLNPERLGTSNDAGTGSPIIGSDGVVESGNGRTMAIATAYSQNSPQAQRYREFVRAEAERQGIDPSAVDEMQQPVLVRERVTNVDRADFARRANESQVAGMTAYEQAQADADSLTADDLQTWSPDDSGDPLAASNRSFQRGFVQRLGNNEASRYTTRDGQATPELGQRMQRAVFAAAYQDADMVEMVTEQAESMRNLATGLQTAAADLAVARETGSREALDAIGTINDAVRIVRRSRQDGISVRELTRQADAFSDLVPETTALLAVAINNNMRSRQAMTTAFRYIGSAVRNRAEGEANGALFADESTNQDTFNAGFQGQNQNQRPQQRPSEGGVQPGAQRGEPGTEGQRQAETTGRTEQAPQSSQEVNDEPLLSTYTEQDIAEREQAQQQAEQADTQQRNQQAQRAQADTEADDFTLAGSNRTADTAAAQGQQDLTDATQEAEPPASQEAADEAPKPKRRNKPLQYTGYSGEERSVRSYQEVGDYRIAKLGDNFYEVIDPDGQAISQMAGPDGAAREAERLNNLSPDDPRYKIGQSDGRPVSSEDIKAALEGSPELADVTVIQSTSELPTQSLLMMALQGVNPRDVRGLFVGDQLYVIADNVDSVQEGISTAVHEAVGHKGMRAVLGEDLERVMLNLYRNLPNSKEGREALREVRRDYPFLDPSNRKDQVTIGEEMVAHLLEKGHRPKAWQRAVAKIRELLRQLFPSVAWTYTDALSLGERSRDYLRKQQNTAKNDGDQAYALRAKQRTAFETQFNDFTDVDRRAAGKVGSRTPPRRAVEWFKEHADRAGLKIRQGMVDQYAALKEMDEKLYGESALGENIQRSSWVLARMSNAASGALHAMLHNGRIRLDPQEKVIQMQDGDAKGLGEVLGRLGTPAEIERFMGWIAGNRSDRLAKEGKENLFDADEIAAMKSWNRGTLEDGTSRDQRYQEVFTEFQQYRDDVLAIAEQSGIISSDQRAMWRDEFYVPFYRLSEDKGTPTGQMATSGLSRQQAYKRLKGGTDNLNDLLQNTMMNFNHLLDASLKNQAATQAMDNAKQLGMAERVPESNRDTKRSTFVMENGQKVFYEIDDPLVFTALTALAHPGMNSAAMKVMRGFKRVFTNLTTTTPQFMVANLIRDSLQASATSDVSKNAFKNVIEGGRSYKDEKTRAAMLASGASFNFGHLYGNNPDELRAQLTRNMRNAKIVRGPSGVPDFMRAGWSWWNEMNNTAENLNRAAIYSQNKDKGALRAAFESRDLIDFSARGTWPAVRILIDIVPFLNARIQGLDKIYRSGVKPGASVLAEAFGKGKANVTDKQAAARFWTVTGAVTMATVALYLHNQDDEEYQKLEDWQKDTYWFMRFGDQAFFIPKPFEVGAMATLAERVTEQFVDDKATGALFRQRLSHMMTDTFSFSPVPQMMQPALDIYANYDAFTGRPIEGMGMERLSPELRKRAGTSKAGEWISTALNSTVGAIGDPDKNPLALSPVQVDHLIGGYFGQVGTWAASSGDIAWRVATGVEEPARRWYEYQPVRRFYSNLGDEDRYTKYGTIFYEGLREASRAYSDVNELREMGRLADAAEVAADKREMLALRQPLNRAQRRLSTINQQIDIIRRSNIDGELKRQRIDRLTATKNQIQRALGERVQEVRAR
ncbi:LPD38 domain-containing protein [Vreelandella neptunia]|uniref:LPD38 domain-containing protein n=1 Tax=Vreelandella neptunia TaxID=115551 RepID=UPI00315A1E7F